MKWRALKSKQDCQFWSCAKVRKVFSKMNDSVNYSLQKWIIYLPHVIQSPIEKYYITVEFDDENGGLKTEVSKKLFLKLSVREPHI